MSCPNNDWQIVKSKKTKRAEKYNQKRNLHQKAQTGFGKYPGFRSHNFVKSNGRCLGLHRKPWTNDGRRNSKGLPTKHTNLANYNKNGSWIKKTIPNTNRPTH
ncbi:hypothetical protein SUGI_0399570 [Cryptomeria japonica]|nr:hypothetical protein SUGI_0399570 [Cryptomeria japonica]